MGGMGRKADLGQWALPASRRMRNGLYLDMSSFVLKYRQLVTRQDQESVLTLSSSTGSL